MNDSFISPQELLEAKSQQGWSGCCTILEPQDTSVGWQVYLQEGKLQYATSNVGQKFRLNYLSQQLSLNFSLVNSNRETIDYKQIYQCFLDNKISTNKAQEILLQLNREALTQILSLGNTQISLSDNKLSGKAVAYFSWQSLIDSQQIASWQEVRNYLKSPLSRLYLAQNKAFNFYKYWKNLAQSDPQFADLANSQKMSDWVGPLFKKVTLYEYADILGISSLTLASYLQIFIENKLIEVLPYDETKLLSSAPIVTTNSKNNSLDNSKSQLAKFTSSNQNDNLDLPPIIACIDDSKTVQKQVTMILRARGYEVINITDASTTFKNLSRQPPILILMDINMPEINGYELCSMLRRSQKFKEIPIIMLTGRDGIIDRMRAKMVGANKYLTKPFEPAMLLNMVQENISV